MSGSRGFTLIEVLVASVLATLLAGGVLMAFAMSAKLSHTATQDVEATYFAQQTLERFRNKIACGEGFAGEWFDSTCNPTLPPSTTDPLGGALPGGTRDYTVVAGDDFDGIGGPDYYKVNVKVHWDPPQ